MLDSFTKVFSDSWWTVGSVNGERTIRKQEQNREPAHKNSFLYLLGPSHAADKFPPLFALSLSIIVYKAATLCQA